MQARTYTARIYDTYNEMIEAHYHHDPVMLENIVRGDWEDCPVARWFAIYNDNDEEIVWDCFKNCC